MRTLASEAGSPSPMSTNDVRGLRNIELTATRPHHCSGPKYGIATSSDGPVAASCDMGPCSLLLLSSRALRMGTVMQAVPPLAPRATRTCARHTRPKTALALMSAPDKPRSQSARVRRASTSAARSSMPPSARRSSHASASDSDESTDSSTAFTATRTAPAEWPGAPCCRSPAALLDEQGHQLDRRGVTFGRKRAHGVERVAHDAQPAAGPKLRQRARVCGVARLGRPEGHHGTHRAPSTQILERVGGHRPAQRVTRQVERIAMVALSIERAQQFWAHHPIHLSDASVNLALPVRVVDERHVKVDEGVLRRLRAAEGHDDHALVEANAHGGVLRSQPVEPRDAIVRARRLAWTRRHRRRARQCVGIVIRTGQLQRRRCGAVGSQVGLERHGHPGPQHDGRHHCRAQYEGDDDSGDLRGGHSSPPTLFLQTRTLFFRLRRRQDAGVRRPAASGGSVRVHVQ
eukprot:3567568-Prymnesium_polylepis.2